MLQRANLLTICNLIKYNKLIESTKWRKGEVMKKHMFRVSFLLLLLSTAHANFGDVPDEYVAVSFSSLYPMSPLKKTKVLAIQLWAEVNEAAEDVVARDILENSIVDFTYTVLDLHTLCDLLAKDIQAQLNGTSARYQYKNIQKALEEVRYLTDLIGSLEQTFDRAMDGHVSDQAACVKVVLDRIKKKMERTLQSAP